MKVRFLRNNDFTGTRTVILSGVAVIEDRRFFVEYGQIWDIQDYILKDSGAVAIITLDDGIFDVKPSDVELFEPSGYGAYTPSDCGCGK